MPQIRVPDRATEVGEDSAFEDGRDVEAFCGRGQDLQAA
jgi:hypothetical protein